MNGTHLETFSPLQSLSNQMSANVGGILGNLVGALLRTILTDDQLLSWGWRVAFISGIAILPVTIYIRIYGREHHPNEGEYDEQQEGIDGSTASQKHPLSESVKRENWPALFSSILVPFLYSGGYYLSVVWLAIFMETLLEPPVSGAFWVNLACNCIGITATSVFAGWLSDRFGRVKLMTVSTLLNCLFFHLRCTTMAFSFSMVPFFNAWRSLAQSVLVL